MATKSIEGHFSTNTIRINFLIDQQSKSISDYHKNIRFHINLISI